MSKFHLYLIINKINNNFYIGETSEPEKRWYHHKYLATNKKYNYPLYNSINKYGIDNFQFQIVESYETEKEALQEEIWWISYFKSLGAVLYNITNGGQGGAGRKHSLETRQKISQSNKGKQNRLGQKNSEEQNKNISIALSGKIYSKNRKQSWYSNYYGRNFPPGITNSIPKIFRENATNPKGKNGKQTKLNELQVKEIKKLIKEGISGRAIAKMFGVGKSIISDIGRGRCWAQVTIN